MIIIILILIILLIILILLLIILLSLVLTMITRVKIQIAFDDKNQRIYHRINFVQHGFLFYVILFFIFRKETSNIGTFDPAGRPKTFIFRTRGDATSFQESFTSPRCKITSSFADVLFLNVKHFGREKYCGSRIG